MIAGALGAVCVAMVLMTTAAHSQQARNDGAFLHETCGVLASAPEDLSSVNSIEFAKAMSCAGYLTATHAALSRVHEYFKSSYPRSQ